VAPDTNELSHCRPTSFGLIHTDEGTFGVAEDESLADVIAEFERAHC
jgi:hypothetical protein